MRITLISPILISVISSKSFWEVKFWYENMRIESFMNMMD